MTQLIDLMPESCRARMSQRRRTRQWSVLFGTTIIGTALSWALLGVAMGRMEASVFAQQAHLQMVSHQRTRAAEIRSRVGRLAAEQARHDRLAWPVRVVDVIETLGALTPDRVTLTGIAVTPRQVRRLGAARGSDSEGARLAVEVSGLAVSDLDLAKLLAGLEGHPLFSMVAVDYSREAQVFGASAREFGVTCEIELSVRYRFEEASDDGAAQADASLDEEASP